MTESENKRWAGMRLLMDRIESKYDFECVAGPLGHCSDWVQLKAALTDAPKLTLLDMLPSNEQMARSMAEAECRMAGHEAHDEPCKRSANPAVKGLMNYRACGCRGHGVPTTEERKTG